MTISKGSNLSITAGGSSESIAVFSSSQAGVVYSKPGSANIASGFLLDISGTTVTKAGAQADLHTATASPFQFIMITTASSTTLRMLTVDNSTPPLAEVTPITKTATQLVGGSPLTLVTPTDVDNSQVHSIFDFDGDSLCTLLDTTQSFWYLTLSNGSSQGNTVTFNPTPAAGSLMMGFAQFSSTSGVLCYFQGTTSDYVGLPLSKSGLTLSSGTPFTINSTNVGISGLAPMAACRVSNNRILAGYIDASADKNLQTIDNPTTVNANTTIAASAADCWLERFHSGSAVIFADTGVTCDWSEVTIAVGGGLTFTNTVAGSGTTGNNARGAMSRLDSTHIVAVFGGGSMNAAVLTTDVSPPGISSNQFTAAPMGSKPCDIDSDGTYIYIGSIASDNTPILIQFATALNADGSVVFNPAAGDDIGVECARHDADTVYVAGNFGTPVVEVSSDAGASFSDISPSGAGAVKSFTVGPDSDNRILIFEDTSNELSESIDGGTTWDVKNAAVSQSILSMARLGIDAGQVVFGNSSTDAETVTHSVSSGAGVAADLVELPGGPEDVDVSGVIIN